MAGFSPELGQMLRVFPILPNVKIRTRSSLVINLERNRLDSRNESWALKDRSPASILNQSPAVEQFFLKKCLDKNLSSSVDELNTSRKSLGILKAKYSTEIKTRKEINDPAQIELFQELERKVAFRTANDYFMAPYIKLDIEGHQKRFQIREWGLYELMRKYEMKGRKLTIQDIQKSLYLDTKREVYFVVGNMNHARNVWLIIKIFSFKKQNYQLPLFDDQEAA